MAWPAVKENNDSVHQAWNHGNHRQNGKHNPETRTLVHTLILTQKYAQIEMGTKVDVNFL